MLRLGILAQSDPASDLLNPGTHPFSDFNATDTLIILGFIILLVLALFAWAFFIRRRPTEQLGAKALVRPSRRSRRRSSRAHEEKRSEVVAEDSDRKQRVRRRRRRRAHEDLPRNPTLGETGGLPPPRPDEADDAPPPAESRV